jgi:hypothetical protein
MHKIHALLGKNHSTGPLTAPSTWERCLRWTHAEHTPPRQLTFTVHEEKYLICCIQNTGKIVSVQRRQGIQKSIGTRKITGLYTSLYLGPQTVQGSVKDEVSQEEVGMCEPGRRLWPGPILSAKDVPGHTRNTVRTGCIPCASQELHQSPVTIQHVIQRRNCLWWIIYSTSLQNGKGNKAEFQS